MKDRLITILSIAAILAFSLLGRSCAKTSTPPSGGPKDTIPPVLISITPENGTINFPRYGAKVALLFNEYTVVKNQSDIIMSPPHRKKPQTKVKGKNIIVSFPDTLMADRTYTIDFGETLVDNNEGNIAPKLVYTFSTGSEIDSMYLTGSVIDSKTLKPVKKALVTVYSDLSDSACFLAPPDAATKSDDWGFFVIRNIKPVPYRIYAYSDNDGDFKYDPNGDDVAFCDSVYTPSHVVRDSIFELGGFLMKDTVRCQSRQPMVNLLMFKELQSVQYLQKSGRRTDRSGFLKFSAANVQINSLDFFGIEKDQVILQYNQTRDSIDFWINTKYKLSDSLLIKIDYMKTDSTGVLSAAVENLSLAVMEEEESSSGKKGSQQLGEKKQKDTVFVLTSKVANETVESEGLAVISEWPVIEIVQDSIHFTETNPKGKTVDKKFSLRQDSLDIRKYYIIPQDELIKGYDYEVKLPQGTMKNLERLPNKEISIKFQIPQDEKLSTLYLDLKNVKCRVLIDLTDDNDKTLRQFVADEDKIISVPYLAAGKYKIRITRDDNRNGYLDTGNLLARRQPEKVVFYQSSEDKPVLEVPESVEITQEINIGELFK